MHMYRALCTYAKWCYYIIQKLNTLCETRRVIYDEFIIGGPFFRSPQLQLDQMLIFVAKNSRYWSIIDVWRIGHLILLSSFVSFAIARGSQRYENERSDIKSLYHPCRRNFA